VGIQPDHLFDVPLTLWPKKVGLIKSSKYCFRFHDLPHLKEHQYQMKYMNYDIGPHSIQLLLGNLSSQFQSSLHHSTVKKYD